jgi:CheY-like chemotaxis protein
LIRDLNIRSIGVGEFFTLEFEQSISDTYIKQGLGLPSVNDKREIRDVVEHLVPLVEGKRILWVDDHPENNHQEQAIFTKFKINVQSVRTSALAQQELLARPNYYDLMISDWNRDPQQDPNKAEGLRFLEEIRAIRIEIPVIFYHGIVDEQQLNQRRNSAKQAGAIGTTGSPGELLKWTMAGLVSKSLLP